MIEILALGCRKVCELNRRSSYGQVDEIHWVAVRFQSLGAILGRTAQLVRELWQDVRCSDTPAATPGAGLPVQMLVLVLPAAGSTGVSAGRQWAGTGSLRRRTLGQSCRVWRTPDGAREALHDGQAAAWMRIHQLAPQQLVALHWPPHTLRVREALRGAPHSPQRSTCSRGAAWRWGGSPTCASPAARRGTPPGGGRSAAPPSSATSSTVITCVA